MGTNVIWSDLHLDLNESYLVNNELLRKPIVNDLKVDKNIDAIRNSIRNIFTTSPGTKILAPEFGLDLRRFLFDQLTEISANLLADEIHLKLPEMDQRLIIEKIIVGIDQENLQYIIDLQISVPSLNITGLSVKGILNNDGFVNI